MGQWERDTIHKSENKITHSPSKYNLLIVEASLYVSICRFKVLKMRCYSKKLLYLYDIVILSLDARFKIIA